MGIPVILQGIKLAAGDIPAISAYSPLDLLSGDAARVNATLNTLADNPQNNIRGERARCGTQGWRLGPRRLAARGEQRAESEGGGEVCQCVSGDRWAGRVGREEWRGEKGGGRGRGRGGGGACGGLMVSVTGSHLCCAASFEEAFRGASTPIRTPG